MTKRDDSDNEPWADENRPLLTDGGKDDSKVIGHNTGASGETIGVWGEVDSDGGYGVRGFTNATNGSSTGVAGTTSAAGDGAAGVYGEAGATTGATIGVDGVTQSADSEAAGIRGSTTGDNYGVKGQVYTDEGNLPTLASFESAAVYGRTDKSDGWAVVGWSNNSDAVFARTDDSNSYALYGFNSTTDGYALGSFGPAYVNGHADIEDVGVSAYLSGNQSIPDATLTTVAFDQTEDDDFSGFNASTGVYTVQEDGDYHVDFLIDWYDSFSSGDTIDYNLLINSSTHGGLAADTTIPGTMDPSRSFGKTLFRLSDGDTIEVEVSQQSGSAKSIWGNANGETYLTIHKVG